MPRRRSLLLYGVIAVAVAAVVVLSSLARTAGTPPRPAPATASATDPPTMVISTSLPPSTSSAADQPVASPVPVGAIVDATERAIGPGMTLGVAVLDVATGDLAQGRSGHRPFMAASLTKLLVVVDLLDRLRADGRAVPEADLALVGRALSSSDDAAMSALWGRYDGHGAVRRLAAGLGLTGTTAPSDPSQWGDTTMTAGDLARVYRHILRDMAAEDRAVIVDALAGAQPTATDGFDQFYGLLRAGGSQQVYAKQAWVPYRPAGYLLHSAGVVHDGRTGHDYAIALLSIQSYVSDQTARDRLSTVAAAALDAVAPPG